MGGGSSPSDEEASLLLLVLERQTTFAQSPTLSSPITSLDLKHQ